MKPADAAHAYVHAASDFARWCEGAAQELDGEITKAKAGEAPSPLTFARILEQQQIHLRRSGALAVMFETMFVEAARRPPAPSLLARLRSAVRAFVGG